MSQKCLLLSKNKFYECRGSLHAVFGAEVHGVDLNTQDLDEDDFFSQLKQDLTRYRILLFRNHQSLTGQRQVDISRGLGRIHSTFYKHPKSPHPDVFRVSNDESEGCTNVGRSGWHIDGTFLRSPFMYQTMHFPSVVEGGDTYFVPLKELYERQDSKTRQRWDRLWMVTGRSFVHPLVYKHPTRKDTTMCFHCGRPFVYGWIMDGGCDDDIENTLDQREYLPAEIVRDEISRSIDALQKDLVLKMKWQAGDFAINDNVALAHYAVPGTQKNPKKVGLRILHRTTILSERQSAPCKEDGRTSFSIL